MQSHHYHIQARETGQLLLWPLAILLGLSTLLHLAAATGWWPPPRPTQDADQTILVHQADASRIRSEADLVLLGDSSCLMDVQSGSLGEMLGKTSLNLGTFSYLDLNAAAWLLQEFSRANPGYPDWVVVLLHPEALLRAAPEPQAMQFLQCYLAGRSPPAQHGLAGRIQGILGLTTLRDRVLDRLVPVPLPGSFGRYYGFSADLERYMSRNQGSALDPESRPFRGNAEYDLSASLKPASHRFRGSVPQQARLAIGITPIPESFAPPNYAQHHSGMLAQWGRWMEADAMLEELPATMPDGLFAKTTHLNEEGRLAYTRLLAAELKDLGR